MIGRNFSLVAMAVISLLSVCATARGAEAELGGQAPFFFVSSYNPEACGEKRIFLDRLVGKKAKEPKKLLLISFFDIDCEPCRKELPFLERLYKKYRPAGLAVLAVNCDYRKEKIEELKAFVKKAGFTFPVLKDRFQALQRRYGVVSFPTMFIVNQLGKIEEIRVGYNEKKKPFPLEEVQKKLGVKVEAFKSEKQEVDHAG